MTHPNLLPGDVFLTSNPQRLGKSINFIQNFWLLMPGHFTHAGIILDDKGNTLEALSTIRKGHINNYKGQKVLIGRHKDMSIHLFDKGLTHIEQYEGMTYPFHRLLFFLFPPLAKYVHLADWGVCSEITCKFFYEMGLLDFWRGVFPGHLATMVRKWKDFRVVYDGEWKGK